MSQTYNSSQCLFFFSVQLPNICSLPCHLTLTLHSAFFQVSDGQRTDTTLTPAVTQSWRFLNPPAHLHSSRSVTLRTHWSRTKANTSATPPTSWAPPSPIRPYSPLTVGAYWSIPREALTRNRHVSRRNCLIVLLCKFTPAQWTCAGLSPLAHALREFTRTEERTPPDVWRQTVSQWRVTVFLCLTLTVLVLWWMPSVAT